MADVGISPNEYLGLGPLGYWIGRELLGGRAREEQEYNLARALFQPRVSDVTTPTGRYQVGPSLGEREFGPTPGSGALPGPTEAPGPALDWQRPGPWEYQGVWPLRQDEPGLGLPRRPEPPPAAAAAAPATAEPLPARREPIERVPVTGRETTTERRVTPAPSYAEMLLSPGLSNDQVQALRRYGPGLEEVRQAGIREQGFTSFERNLAQGMPFHKAFEAALPAIMRNSKGTQLDDVLRAYNVARQGGSMEDIAKGHEAAGEYEAANAARAGVLSYSRYMDNRAKASRAAVQQDTLEQIAQDFERRGMPNEAAIVRAGRAGAPVAGVVREGMSQQGQTARTTQREEGLTSRQGRELDVRQAEGEKNRQNRLAVETLRGQNHLKVMEVIRGGDVRKAQVTLVDLRREQAGLERQMKADLAALDNAQMQKLPTDELEQTIEEHRQRLQEIEQEARLVRQRIWSGAEGGRLPLFAPEAPVAPAEPAPAAPIEERAPGPSGAARPAPAGAPRDRLDALARARFGVPFMELSRSDRAIIVQQFNSEQP